MNDSHHGLSLRRRYGAQLSKSTRVLSALRYPQYRRFWLGTLASVSSYQIVIVALGWLVYDITKSPLQLGLVGLVVATPAILLNLVGGVMADKLDQRRLIMTSQSIIVVLLLVLATITVLDVVKVRYVLAIAFLIGAVGAFDQPARQALFPHLLDRKELMNAVSLNSAIWQGTRIVAPAIGGVIIAQAGTGAAFYVSAVGPMVLVFALSTILVPPIPRSQGKTAVQDMGEGLRFIRENGIFTFLIGMTFFNSFFGMSYVHLMPVFASKILDVGPSGLGFLFTASGLGALLGTFITASLGNFPRKGWLLIAGATFFGGFLVLFALSEWYPLSLGALFLAGVFNSLYMISTLTTLQMMVHDQLRGRVMGVYGMTWSIMPLGGMQAGAVATILGAPFAVAMGGLAVAAFALGIATSNRRVRQLGGVALGGQAT